MASFRTAVTEPSRFTRDLLPKTEFKNIGALKVAQAALLSEVQALEQAHGELAVRYHEANDYNLVSLSKRSNHVIRNHPYI